MGVGIRRIGLLPWEGFMDQGSPELAGEVLRLMIQDGVTLTGDLNQCERAVAAWVRKVGAASIEAHLAGKKRF
jgi:hypothetical protein